MQLGKILLSEFKLPTLTFVCDLGKEPPPLPVLEFEVAGTVPLNDFHGAQLLLTFTESPEEMNERLQQDPPEASQHSLQVQAYLRARKPLACAWKAMMTTVSLRSLSSSSWAKTPVLKNILL